MNYHTLLSISPTHEIVHDYRICSVIRSATHWDAPNWIIVAIINPFPFDIWMDDSQNSIFRSETRMQKLYGMASATTDLTAFSDLRWGQRTFSKCEYNKKNNKETSQTSNFVQCHWCTVRGVQRSVFCYERKCLAGTFFSSFLSFFFSVSSVICLLWFHASHVCKWNWSPMHILSGLVGYKKVHGKKAQNGRQDRYRGDSFLLTSNKEEKKNDNENNNKKLDKANSVEWSYVFDFRWAWASNENHFVLNGNHSFGQ